MKTKLFLITVSLLLVSSSCTFGSSKPMSGLVNTTDGGVDWQFANKVVSTAANKTTTTNLNGMDVSKIMFDPTNRQEVYVSGFTGGLYAWQASSSAWTELLSNILAYDFVVDPQATTTMYVAGLFNDHGRVVETTDGGKTWQQVFDDASTDNSVRTIVMNPANSNELVIGLADGSIIQSQDAGYTWKLLTDFNDRVNRMLWQNNTLYVLLRDQGLYQSTDDGQTFTKITASINAGLTSNQNQYYGEFYYNQFYVDPLTSQLMYVTTSDGLYKSIDGGQNWAYIQLPVRPETSLTEAIAVAPSTSNIIFTSIGSTIYKSTDGGNTWQTQKVDTTGIIDYIVIDPQIPQIDWAGVYGSAD